MPLSDSFLLHSLSGKFRMDNAWSEVVAHSGEYGAHISTHQELKSNNDSARLHIELL